MPEIWAGELGELRASSTASGGTALTSTAGYIPFPAIDNAMKPPKKRGHLFITPRNFATAVVAKVTLNPWLTILETADDMVTLPTDYSVYGQDGSASTDIDMDSFNTRANGDYLLIGSHHQFRGVRVDVDDSHPNGTASVLTVNFWAGVWRDLSATDGSIAATGKTFGQDGLVSWTVPGGWQLEKLENMYSVLKGQNLYYAMQPLYWTRWEVDTQLDSDTLVDGMYAANRSASYIELMNGQTLEERVEWGFNALGCVEALTNAGTANLIVNLATEKDSLF